MRILFSCASILITVASSVSFLLAQQRIQSGPSDREKAELRGPVRRVREERTFSGADGQERGTTLTTEYTPDGRILKRRRGNADSPEWVTSYTYARDGRLLKMSDGKTGSPPESETTYLYDNDKKLVGVKSGDKFQAHFQYDNNGRKSLIENYDSKPLDPHVAYGGHWEGSDLGFAPSPGGSLTTTYNEQGVAIGAELRDATGKLLGHIGRKFDSEGRIVGEEQFADAPRELDLPEEFRSKLNPEQMKTMGAFVAGAQNLSISYSYDHQGRVLERRRAGGVFGEEVTTTTYNDQGDKSSERTTTVMSAEVGRQYGLTEAGAMIPTGQAQPAQTPEVSETQYTYQYDEYGNWTEQSVAVRSQSDATFRASFRVQRKLTYY